MSSALFTTRSAPSNGSADSFEAVTPNDEQDLPNGVCRGLHVGVGGVLHLVDAEGHVARFVSGTGQYHPLSVARVLAQGTTADGIVALY